LVQRVVTEKELKGLASWFVFQEGQDLLIPGFRVIQLAVSVDGVNAAGANPRRVELMVKWLSRQYSSLTWRWAEASDNEREI
jgi:hypothetical protein